MHMTQLIEDALETKGSKLKGATVTVLGIAYLENADDTRNTPAAALIKTLEEKGARVILHDPYVREWDLGPHEIERDLQKAAEDSDCLALVTKHRDYNDLDFEKLGSVMRTRILVDGRNVFEKDAVRSHDFEYRAIGKVGLSN
jgi:UDP-N-acetyl-D-mannosaminuronic acid dehydrogenase